jgi:hypothetical protein
MANLRVHELVFPEPLEAIRRERSIARGILNVAVSQVSLQRAGIVAAFARSHARQRLVHSFSI